MVRTLNADRSAAIKKRNTGASGTGRTRRGNVRMADTVLNSGNAEMGSRGRTRTGRRAQTTAGHTGRPAQALRSSHAVKPAAKGVNGVRVDEASLDASPSVPIRRTSAMSLHKVGFMIILIVVMTVLLINYIKLQADVTSSSQEIAAMEQQLTQLKAENDAAYNEINDSISLEEVRRRAIQELGMKYADRDQVVIYSGTEKDTVHQVSSLSDK